jgi:hypothetical protein
MSKIEVGSVVKCQHRKLGVVTAIRRRWSGNEGYTIIHYEGIAFDGTPWTSKNPVFVAKNLNEYILSTYKRYS